VSLALRRSRWCDLTGPCERERGLVVCADAGSPGCADPYSRFQEASEITMNIDDHSKPGRPARGREHIEEGPPPESSGLPQARPSHLALDAGKRLVGVGLQLADPLDGREDLVVVAPVLAFITPSGFDRFRLGGSQAILLL
jgi:hypothetical protein